MQLPQLVVPPKQRVGRAACTLSPLAWLVLSCPVPAPVPPAAVEAFALSKGLKRMPGPDPQYEDICFGTAPLHTDLEGLSAVFPSIEIQFDQVRARALRLWLSLAAPARLAPPCPRRAVRHACTHTTAAVQGTSLVLGPLNYLFVHTFNSGKYCLGVFDNGRAGACWARPFRRRLCRQRVPCTAQHLDELWRASAHPRLRPQAPFSEASLSATCSCGTTEPTTGLALGQVRACVG